MTAGGREPSEIWTSTWAQLARATRDRRHAFRHPVVATRCPRYGARARTVVLREASRADARLVLYTDRRAAKLEGLGIEPRMSWCFYDGRRRVQVRAETLASLHVGDAVARSAWKGQGGAARALYAVEPAPATPLDGAEPEFDRAEDAGFENFAVVACDVVELDWLELAREGHRRVRFERGDDGQWSGTPIVP